MNPTVDTILQQINLLTERDQLVVAQKVSEMADAQWIQEVEVARRVAKQRSIDQAAIGQARYGR